MVEEKYGLSKNKAKMRWKKGETGNFHWWEKIKL